jgi:hypothetical protein
MTASMSSKVKRYGRLCNASTRFVCAKVVGENCWDLTCSWVLHHESFGEMHQRMRIPQRSKLVPVWVSVILLGNSQLKYLWIIHGVSSWGGLKLSPVVWALGSVSVWGAPKVCIVSEHGYTYPLQRTHFFFSFIHMCMQCLGHFFPHPPPHPTPTP